MDEQSVDSHTEQKYQVPYIPRSQGKSIQTLHPTSLVTPMQVSLDRVEAVAGKAVDDFVAEKLQCDPATLHSPYAAEQVDSLAIALLNQERGRPTLIAHDTGTGKGRIVSGLVDSAISQDKIVVFVTADPSLYVDMLARDMVDTGVADRVRPFFTNADLNLELMAPDGAVSGLIKTPKLAKHDAEMKRLIEQYQADGTLGGGQYNVIFTTYHQISTKGTARRALLETIAPSATFILDECDLGGGGSGPIKPLNKQELSQQALGKDVRDIPTFITQTLLPQSDSYVLLSATAFKSPYVLSRLMHPKSEIQEANANAEDLAATLTSQGIPGQQDFCTKLALAGELVRLEKDMAGVSFEATPVSIDLQTLDDVTTIMAHIMTFDRLKEEAVEDMEEALKESAKAVQANDGSTGQAAIENTNFTSTAYNFMQQFLFCAKVEGIAQAAIEAIESGQKPKIQFFNTMGSLLEAHIENQKEHIEQQVIAEAEANDETLTDDQIKKAVTKRYQDWQSSSPVIDLDVGDMLVRQLDKCRMVTIKDAYGKRERHYLTDDELGPEACKVDAEIRRLAQSRSWDIPISPIDAIIHRVQEAGYTISEMSGRTLGLDYSGAAPRLKEVDASDPKHRAAAKNGFNNGEVDALITNVTTGWSGHASRAVKDQRQRVDIVAQPHPDGNKFMQALGRVNRTGQVNPTKHSPDWVEDGTPGWGEVHGKYGIPGQFGLPEIKMLYTEGVPYEKRIAAERNRKMASLNANTTGNRSSGMELGGPDFSDSYGDVVAVALCEDHPDWYAQMDYPLGRPVPSGDENEGAIRKVTGRSLFLPLAEQEKLMAALEMGFKEYIQQREAMGESPYAIKVLDLQAQTIGRVEIQPARNPESIFGGPTYVEVVRARALRKPFTSETVANQVRESLGLGELPAGTSPDGDFQPDSDSRLAGKQRAAQIIEDLTAGVTAQVDDLQRQVDQLKAEREQKLQDLQPQLEAQKKRVEELKKQQETLQKQADEADQKVKLKAQEKQIKAEEKKLAHLEKERKRIPLQTDHSPLVQQISQLNMQLTRAKERIELCPIGQPVRIYEKDCSMEGIVTDMERVKGIKSPLAGGAWKFRIAVADAAREITLKLSEINSGKCSVFPTETGMQLKPPFDRIPVHQLFDEGQREVMETRQIVTGNLLASPIGRQYISFTNNHDQVRQGLLLPKSYDIQKALAEMPVMLSEPQHMERLFQANRYASGKVQLQTSDEGLNMTPTIEAGKLALQLEVPSSKRGGADYYKDPAILALTEKGEFEKRGKSMQAVVQNDQIPTFLELLESKGIGLLVKDKKLMEVARAIKGESLQQVEWFKDGDMPDLVAQELLISPEAIREQITQQKAASQPRMTTPNTPTTSQPIQTIQPAFPDRAPVALESLIEDYRQFFADGQTFTNIVEARKFAAARQEGLSDKQVDECIEKSLVRQGREIMGQNPDPLDAFDQMRDLYERQPNLSSRTSSSIIHQQYSTPVPIGLLVQQLAGIDSTTVVYEPTAGNGSLLTQADPSRVVANELDPNRVAELKNQGFAATQYDATEYRPPDQSVDRVVTNPPFGYVHDHMGKPKHWVIDLSNPAPGTKAYETSQVDHAIAFSALAAMKDDGKAVLVLGAPLQQKMKDRADAASDAYNEPQSRAFFHTLYNNYNVTQHFTVAGDLYAKQGTTFPIDVVVIEGRGQGQSQLPLPAAQLPPVHRSWDDLRQVLADTLDQRASQQIVASTTPLPVMERVAPVQSSSPQQTQSTPTTQPTVSPQSEASETHSIAPPQEQKRGAERNVAEFLHRAGLADKVLAGNDFHLQIENGPYIPLVVERHPNDRLYLTHYIEQNWDLCLDSEMVFNIKDGKLQLCETAVPNPLTGGESRRCDAQFAQMFSQNILDQGFPEAALVAMAVRQAQQTEQDESPVEPPKLTISPQIVETPSAIQLPTLETVTLASSNQPATPESVEQSAPSPEKPSVSDPDIVPVAIEPPRPAEPSRPNVVPMSTEIASSSQSPSLQEMRDWWANAKLLGRDSNYDKRIAQLASEMLQGTEQVKLPPSERDGNFRNPEFTLSEKAYQAMHRDQAESKALRTPTISQLRDWFQVMKKLGQTEQADYIKQLAQNLVKGTAEENKPIGERDAQFRNPNLVLSHSDYQQMLEAQPKQQNQPRTPTRQFER